MAPPLTLSPNTCLPHRIIPSLHLPPCVCVCVCKRRELDLTLPALGKRTYCTAPHSHQSYVMVRGLRSARSVSSHTWPFSRQSPVSCLSLSALSPPLDHLSLSLAESQNLGLGLLSLCGVCGVCEVCGVCVCARKLRSRGPVPQLWYHNSIMTVRILCIFYPQ